jgi:head-tail adaptor
LRHLVLLQKAISTTDAYGDPAKVWTDQLPRVWASIDPISLTSMAGAREAIMAGAQTNEDIVVITLYPVPGIAAGSWRLLTDDGTDDEQVYDLKATRKSNDASKLVFLATVGASNG